MLFAILAAAHCLLAQDIPPNTYEFVNGLSEPIEVTYSDPSQSTGCATLEPGGTCTIKSGVGSGYYCWQLASAGGTACTPKVDGCEVAPGKTVIGTDADSLRCHPK